MSQHQAPTPNAWLRPERQTIVRLLTVIAMLTLSACAKQLTIKDFQNSPNAYRLRPNEEVLFFDTWIGSPPGYIVATDERVFYWDTYSANRCAGSLGRFTSVDYVDIESVGKVFPLFLWTQVRLRDGRKVSICGVYVHGKVTRIIQAHLEEINEIRQELEATTENVTSRDELDKAVIAELNKRRTIQRALTD